MIWIRVVRSVWPAVTIPPATPRPPGTRPGFDPVISLMEWRTREAEEADLTRVVPVLWWSAWDQSVVPSGWYVSALYPPGHSFGPSQIISHTAHWNHLISKLNWRNMRLKHEWYGASVDCSIMWCCDKSCSFSSSSLFLLQITLKICLIVLP